jgi:Family of unknown function (DUF5995)
MLPLTRPYRTLDEVVDGFSALERTFQQSSDRRSLFLTLYGVVSAAMRTRVAERTFEDNAWVERYAVAFANLYRVALERYEAGRRGEIAPAWRLAFDAARAGTGLALQDVLLGVNAHVNHDLPLALSAVSIDPDRTSRYRDHSAVNRVLGSVTERATERLAALYAPGLRTMDAAAGRLDELISAFSLEVARESAWESAVSLANARTQVERALVTRLLAARSGVMARLLLAPSRDPAFVRLCRTLEGDANWIAVATRAVRNPTAAA